MGDYHYSVSQSSREEKPIQRNAFLGYTHVGIELRKRNDNLLLLFPIEER